MWKILLFLSTFKSRFCYCDSYKKFRVPQAAFCAMKDLNPEKVETSPVEHLLEFLAHCFC